jgi:hypothetical protein
MWDKQYDICKYEFKKKYGIYLTSTLQLWNTAAKVIDIE